MTPKSDSAVEIQRRYYTERAERYEQMHAHEGSEEDFSLRFCLLLLQMLGARSLLDVGSATGSGLRKLQESMPGLSICGVEPVAALIREAERGGHPACIPILQASGEALPFADGSFDVVSEFGILHHVANPNAVVGEMLRVASKAVFISDSNRFGQGSFSLRLIKLALYKLGLWGAYDYLRTGGKRYQLSEGDGLYYSYSVYDSFDLVSKWADRVILVPMASPQGKFSNWLHPLLNSGAVLMCGFRE
jgi:ubiquinone/menaquinone biosynthesis C-methylase UbiE